MPNSHDSAMLTDFVNEIRTMPKTISSKMRKLSNSIATRRHGMQQMAQMTSPKFTANLMVTAMQ